MKNAFFCAVLIQLLAVQMVKAELIIPDLVTAAFQEKFPNVEDVDWEEVNNQFMASFFDEDGYYKKAVFSNEGLWQRTITEIEEEDLPEAVMEYLDVNYENLEFYNSIKMVESQADLKYFVKFQTEEKSIELAFNEEGKLLKK